MDEGIGDALEGLHDIGVELTNWENLYEVDYAEDFA